MDELRRNTAGIQEMRPFLVHNFNPMKTLVQIGQGFHLAWDWATRFGIASIIGGDSEEEVLRSRESHSSRYLVRVDDDGRLLDPGKPWLCVGEAGYSGDGKALPANLYIVNLFHDRLYEFYDQIDFDSIRRRAIEKSHEQGKDEPVDAEADEEIALSCQDLAERIAEEKPAGPRRRIGSLKFQDLASFLERSFNVQVRQGKGSEVILSRPGVERLFRLGCHGNNPEVPSDKVRELLRRLAISKQEWLRVVYK
jgi:hypothetical protein